MNLNEHGLTLPEILIALFIISIGLVGLMVVVPVAAVGVQDGSQVSAATYLAQQRLEQARNAAWTEAPDVDCLGVSATLTDAPVPNGATCDGSTATTFPDEATGTIPGFGQYSRTTRVTDCSVGAGCAGVVHDNLRLVTVTVGYRPLTATGVGASEKTVMLHWMVSRR